MDQGHLYKRILRDFPKFYFVQHIIDTFCKNIEVIIIKAIHKYGRITSSYRIKLSKYFIPVKQG